MLVVEDLLELSSDFVHVPCQPSSDAEKEGSTDQKLVKGHAYSITAAEQVRHSPSKSSLCFLHELVNM